MEISSSRDRLQIVLSFAFIYSCQIFSMRSFIVPVRVKNMVMAKDCAGNVIALHQVLNHRAGSAQSRETKEKRVN